MNASADGGPPILRRPPQFYLAGPGFSVTRFSPVAFGGDLGSVQARDICQTLGCGAGRRVGTNSNFSGTLAEAGAIAVVNGVEFHGIRLIGSLNFVSHPIVVAGSISRRDRTNDFLLVRYNEDGTLDSSFGQDGVVTTDFYNTMEFAADMAITPNGEIVVAGTIYWMGRL